MNQNVLYTVSGGLSRMIFGHTHSLVTFFLMFANLLGSSVEARAKMKKYLWLQELRPCETDPGQAQVNGSFRYTGRGNFQVNLHAYTPKKMEHLYLFVDLKKCPTKLKTDDCEDMMTFPAGDQCQSNAYFTYIFKQFQPPLICPLQGHYRAKNAIVNTDNHLSFFRGLSDEEWLHVYIGVYEDEKRLSKDICLVIIATMRKVRVEEKNDRKKN